MGAMAVGQVFDPDVSFEHKGRRGVEARPLIDVIPTSSFPKDIDCRPSLTQLMIPFVIRIEGKDRCLDQRLLLLDV